MIELLNSVCEFRQQFPGKGSELLKTNDLRLNSIKETLFNIEIWLTDQFQNYRGIEWGFAHSQGAGYFPAILHVSILPPGQKVSDGIYVALCFDIEGRGFLAGCIESKTNPKGLKTVNRSKASPLRIDVNGQRGTTKYNDCFVNPREFYYNQFILLDIVNHIEESLELCLYYLGLGSNEINLNINSILDVGLMEEPFDPENISEGKLKVARQIALRRGQRAFRNQLLLAYTSKCAMTGCGIVDILEAAHISPYNGPKTNHVSNGLLLRPDIHTLFDLGLIAIDPNNFTTITSHSLINTEYERLEGRKIAIPERPEDHPSKFALAYHREHVFKK